MSAHTCHLPGCKAACPPRHLFCGPHWAMVPPETQAEVYATVGKRNRAIDRTWAAWWRAQAAATDAVLRIVYPHQGARIDALLAKETAFADRLDAM